MKSNRKPFDVKIIQSRPHKMDGFYSLYGIVSQQKRKCVCARVEHARRSEKQSEDKQCSSDFYFFCFCIVCISIAAFRLCNRLTVCIKIEHKMSM